MKKIILSIAACVALAANSHAGLQIPLDAQFISSGATSNYTAVIFSSTFTTDFTLGISCVVSNIGQAWTGNGYYSASTDNVNWLTNRITLPFSVNANQTNTVVGLTNCVAGYRFPFYRLDRIDMSGGTNSAASGVRATGYSKDGQ